jgi:asparagine synthetase B (glutamine-hydrolysing)
MCGIAGIISLSGHPIPDALARVSEMHRGSLRRLPQDVDYISTLSGGIDSTLVSLYASDFGKKPLKTLFGQSSDTPAQNLPDERMNMERAA